MNNKNISFITHTNDQFSFGNNTASFYLCDYNIEHFSDNLFEHYKIHHNKILKAVTKRRAEYLAGRICTKLALNKLGIEDTNIMSNSDRSPIWPHGIVGSITHTPDIAAAIVTNNKTVLALGIDCETIMSLNLATKIKEQIISDDEITNKDLNSYSINFLITLLFSAKESIYKALYPQVKQFMDFHNLFLIKIYPKTLTLGLLIDFGP